MERGVFWFSAACRPSTGMSSKSSSPSSLHSTLTALLLFCFLLRLLDLAYRSACGGAYHLLLFVVEAPLLSDETAVLALLARPPEVPPLPPSLLLVLLSADFPTHSSQRMRHRDGGNAAEDAMSAKVLTRSFTRT